MHPALDPIFVDKYPKWLFNAGLFFFLLVLIFSVWRRIIPTYNTRHSACGTCGAPPYAKVPSKDIAPNVVCFDVIFGHD